MLIIGQYYPMTLRERARLFKHKTKTQFASYFTDKIIIIIRFGEDCINCYRCWTVTYNYTRLDLRDKTEIDYFHAIGHVKRVSTLGTSNN